MEELLVENEKKYFEQFLASIHSKFPADRLNFFEHNLEVWQQLWRVCEISDVVMILVDIRHPMFHFPPSLYHYIVHKLAKTMIVVMTKTDLVPPSQVDIWQQFFKTQFPAVQVLLI